MAAIGQAQTSYSYESFAQTVVERHPDRQVDASTLDVARLGKDVVGTLPDPIVTVGRSGISWDEPPGDGATNEGMQKARSSMAAWTVGLSQMLPWPGTLDAEVKAAEAQARSAGVRYDLNQLSRYLEAKEVFLLMAEARQQLEVENENVTQAAKLLEFSEERFRQGLGSHMDMLAARSELALRKANLQTLETVLGNMKARAAIMLGLSPQDPPSLSCRRCGSLPVPKRQKISPAPSSRTDPTLYEILSRKKLLSLSLQSKSRFCARYQALAFQQRRPKWILANKACR